MEGARNTFGRAIGGASRIDIGSSHSRRREKGKTGSWESNLVSVCTVGLEREWQ